MKTLFPKEHEFFLESINQMMQHLLDKMCPIKCDVEVSRYGVFVSTGTKTCFYRDWECIDQYETMEDMNRLEYEPIIKSYVVEELENLRKTYEQRYAEIFSIGKARRDASALKNRVISASIADDDELPF